MKRIIAGFTGLVFLAYTALTSATGFPFQPNQVLNAADLNTALQTAAITSGTIDSARITNSPISGNTGSFTGLTSPSVSLTGGLIDNIPIGTTTPAAGTFTTLTGVSGVFGPLSTTGTLTASSASISNNATVGGTLTASAVTVTSASSVSIGGVNLAGASGASIVGFIQSGTGATATTVQEKERRWIDVRDFGADPTGVADSTSAIIAAASAVPDGGTLLISAGTYLVSSTVTISKKMNVVGQGFASIVSVAAGMGATTDVFLVKAPTVAAIQGFRFSDFYIKPVSGTPGRYGFNFDGTNAPVSNIVFDHVRIDTLGNYAIAVTNSSGLVTGNPFTSTIQNSIVSGGINFTNGGDSLIIQNNVLTGPRDVKVDLVTGAHGFQLLNNNITTNGGTVIGTADQGTIAFNNFEQIASSVSANNCLVDVQGHVGAKVTNLKILGNFLGANNLFVADTVRVDQAVGTEIAWNLIAQGSGVPFRITANADRTQFDLNRHTPDNPISTFLADLGTNTSGRFFNQSTGAVNFYGTQALSNASGVVGVAITSAGVRVGTGPTNTYGFTSGDPSATAIDGGLSRLGAGQLSVDTTTVNNSAGLIVQTGGIDLGTAQGKRLRLNRGTALVAGDFALSAGWGTGATVSSVIGTDQAWTATITAAGTPGANPTLTLTFHDGTFTNSPITVSKMTGGTGTITNLTEAPTATTNVITFNGTPVAASTYIISSIGFGR